jgi:23S rRNA (adenine-N6)-dimethyltransferase
VVVVQVDASDLRLPRRPFTVVANPPFAQTTAILRRLLSSGSRLERARLVVPEHVARRWASSRAPGAGRWGEFYEARFGRHISRKAFSPPATMPCAVLHIDRRA